MNSLLIFISIGKPSHCLAMKRWNGDFCVYLRKKSYYFFDEILIVFVDEALAAELFVVVPPL